MFRLGARSSGILGLTPPDILVFLRIPKTASITVEAVFQRCLPGANFYGHVHSTSSLLVRPTSEIAEKFRQLPPDQQAAVRCLVDTHVGLDVATVFNRPVRFFTIVREPVDRSISNFFHNRVSNHLICYPFIKNMTMEEYLDSGIGIDADNHQVRVLSGAAELDCQWDPRGLALSAPPVERRHLELAKRNIEERFIVAAPMEQVAALIWFLKRLYNWPLQLVLHRKLNEAAASVRPTFDVVSAETRSRLKQMNQFDTELYWWVKERFSIQVASLEPAFSQEVRRFVGLNEYVRRLERTLTSFIVRAAAKRPLISKSA